LEKKITSTSFLQRQLKIGYNQAATITDELEAQGFLSPRNAKGNREILQNF
ncbi:cell division protein, partial [Helicobacter pylori]